MTNEDEGKSYSDQFDIGDRYSRSGDNVLENHISKLDTELQKAQDNLLQLQELKKRLEDAKQINMERAVHQKEHEALHQLKDENAFLKESIKQYQSEIDTVKDSVTSLRKSLAEGMQLFQSKILDSLDNLEKNQDYSLGANVTPKASVSLPEFDSSETLFSAIEEKLESAADKIKDVESGIETPRSFFDDGSIEPEEPVDAASFFTQTIAVEDEPELAPITAEAITKKESPILTVTKDAPETPNFLAAIEQQNDQKIQEADKNPTELEFENRISMIRSQIADIEEKKEDQPQSPVVAAVATEEKPKEAPLHHRIIKNLATGLETKKKKKEEEKAAKKQLKLEQEEKEKKAEAEKAAAKEKAKLAKAEAKKDKDSKRVREIKKAIDGSDNEPLKNIKPDTSVGKLMFKIAAVFLIVFAGGLAYQMKNADKLKETYVNQTKAVLAANQSSNNPTGQDDDQAKKYASAYFDIALEGTVWDTYSDSESYYSLSYPQNTTYKMKKPGSPNLWFLRKDSYLLKVDVTESDLDLKTYITNQNLQVKYSQEDATFARKPAVLMKLQENMPVKGDMYYVKNGKRIYRIWYQTFADSTNPDAARVKKMLDSFVISDDPNDESLKQEAKKAVKTSSPTEDNAIAATPVQEQNPDATTPQVSTEPAQ